MFGRFFWLGAGLLVLALSARAVPGRGTDPIVGISYERTGTLAMPASVLFEGVHHAEVCIAISVDAEGKLVDCMLTAYTERRCADAALAAVKKWTYQPARVNGEARSARTEMTFDFEADVVSVQSGTQNIINQVIRDFDTRYAYTSYRLSQLDKIPTPLETPTPVVKGDDTGVHRVTVEFYIDETGRVRMPVIDRAYAQDPYAAAAVAAVEKWRFEPPLRHGRPVLVLATQDFLFRPKT